MLFKCRLWFSRSGRGRAEIRHFQELAKDSDAAGPWTPVGRAKVYNWLHHPLAFLTPWCSFSSEFEKKKSVQKNHKTCHGDNPQSYHSLTTVKLHGNLLPKYPLTFTVSVQTGNPKLCHSPQSTIKFSTLLAVEKSRWDPQKSLHSSPFI